MVTANRIPVPEPMAPRKSAITERPPIHSPPNAAAVGMYLNNRKKKHEVNEGPDNQVFTS